MTRCEECDEPIPLGDPTVVVSGSGVYCDKQCWEDAYGEPWPFS